MTRATRFGKPLPDGGTIGVAAAASPYDSRSDVLRGRGGRFTAPLVGGCLWLEERLGPLGVPLIYGLPLAHGKHLASLTPGVTCTLGADAKTLTVDEPALRPR